MQVQTVGDPWQVSFAAHAVHLAALWQPWLVSVGTHCWLQFFVPDAHEPILHVPRSQTMVPPPAAGHPALLQPVAVQP